MDNRCVCCGSIIPEGRQVCPYCEKEGNKDAVVGVSADHSVRGLGYLDKVRRWMRGRRKQAG